MSSVIEGSTEYIEDPKGEIARNQEGRVVRMKVKISLSFKGGIDASQSVLKNVQLQIQLPHNLYAE